MLTIRLTRKGRKNQPFFRVVVIDKKRSTKGGRAVEILGFVDPLNKKKSLQKERILYWIKNGAQPSATVHNLLVSEKIIEGKKINVSKKSSSSAKASEDKKKQEGEGATTVAPTASLTEQTPASAIVEEKPETKPEQ